MPGSDPQFEREMLELARRKLARSHEALRVNALPGQMDVSDAIDAVDRAVAKLTAREVRT